MAMLMKRLGHEVTTASTIKGALKAAGEKEFDLVISDLGLPDGLGYELMRSLFEWKIICAGESRSAATECPRTSN